MAVTLEQLCAGLTGVELQGDPGTTITTITSDSRRAGPDTLFVAVPGTEVDGHDFVDRALAAGCRALAVQKDQAGDLGRQLEAANAAWLSADRTRPLPALLSRRLQGEPDRKLWTAGVTGTNGKTTVSFLMREMLARLQGPCGLVGTIAYHDGRVGEPAPLTTPGGPVFYTWLGRMVANGCRSSFGTSIASNANPSPPRSARMRSRANSRRN